ncbi:hypothetical protein RSAG8_02340, partial [Rhizoctonia solani AG-8 WAC10335]
QGGPGHVRKGHGWCGCLWCRPVLGCCKARRKAWFGHECCRFKEETTTRKIRGRVRMFRDCYG